MLETFALRLVLGMLLALVVLPLDEVPPRFYRIHLLIALGLLTLVGAVSWSKEAVLFWLGLGLAGASCFVGTWFWLAEASSLGLVPILLAALGVSVTLSASLTQSVSLSWWVMEHGSSAAQLGLALTAMLLGHYYLIAPGMPQRPLVRLSVLLLAAVIGRAGVALADEYELLTSTATGGLPVERWLALALRWLAGICAAFVFSLGAWRCARIRSTQSATGILYAAVICTFLGELTHLLLERG